MSFLDRRSRCGGLLFLPVIVLVVACGLVFEAAPLWAAQPLPAAELSQAASRDNLGQDLGWRKLLFYVSRVWHKDDSLVDDPTFFLAPDGAFRPTTELEATLKAFYAPVVAGHDDEHALCRYPARHKWLADHLKFPPGSLPTPNCARYADWLERFDVGRVSLVFASNFLNNPASMFGHTFLRFHRRPARPGAPEPPALLDFAVNFAANPTTSNPLAYSFLGLTGGFPGTFDLLPYYLKIQEYNNSESRDLWEYDLNLTAAEVQKVMAVLWEVGPHYIDYYYIDGNCSYVMMAMLDAVRPSLKLDDQFTLLTTPADTIRVAYAEPGLMGVPKFRPSSLSRFRERESALTPAEQDLVKEIFRAEAKGWPLPNLTPLPEARRAAVLDAALDWIDYDEALAGTRQAQKHRLAQNALLEERSKLPVASAPLVQVPRREEPELGTKSIMVALGGGRDVFGRDFAEAEWRPTLHIFESPSLGYSDALQMQMVNVAARVTEHRATLDRVNLFDAESLAPLAPMMTPLSWELSIAAQRERFGGEHLRRFIEGGPGLSWTPLGGPVKLYTLGIVQAGWSASFAEQWYLEPALLTGALWSIAPNIQWSVLWRPSRTYELAHGERQDHRLRVATTWQVRPTIELKAYVDSETEGVETGLQLGYYL